MYKPGTSEVKQEVKRETGRAAGGVRGGWRWVCSEKVEGSVAHRIGPVPDT